MTLKIKILGSRGSLASPTSPRQLLAYKREILEEYLAWSQKKGRNDLESFLQQSENAQFGGFGGNTICVKVETPLANLIIDCGTGIHSLNRDYLIGQQSSITQHNEFHIFITHFHWDHLMGLPFFTPLYKKGNVINFYGVQPDLPQAIQQMFTRPFFPVSFEHLPSTIVFNCLAPREKFILKDISVTPYQLDHPDPCWGYKIEHQGRVFSHCVDTECRRVGRSELGVDLPLYQSVDLMFFDAQYSFKEHLKKIDWGHSAAHIGLDIAEREQVKKIVFLHHDPNASDQQIAELVRETQEYYLRIKNNRDKKSEYFYSVDWCFACEGLEFEL